MILGLKFNIKHDDRARSDLNRILKSGVRRKNSKKYRKATVLASIAIFGTSVVGGVAAATDMFQSKANEAFEFGGNAIGPSVADPQGGQMLAEITMPNGSLAQYWETPMFENGEKSGACRIIVFSDRGVTTVLPGKERSYGASCGAGTTEAFGAFGGEEFWTSLQDNMQYVLAWLTAPGVSQVEFCMDDGSVIKAEVKNKRALAVLPKSLADKRYVIAAMDTNGQVIDTNIRTPATGPG